MSRQMRHHNAHNKLPFLFKRRLKHVVSLRQFRIDSGNDGGPYVGLENIESRTGRLLNAPADGNGTGTTVVQPASLSSTFEPGDVLFGKLRPYLAKAWVADFSGQSSTEFLVMIPTGIEPRFLLYICLWSEFVDTVNASTFGSKMPRAEWDSIGNVSVPLPDRTKQLVIADYLDREMARLDALVAEKRRLIALLAEKRQSLIISAVTRGIDSDVVLRESGVFWIGRVPVHWGTERARWLFRERDDRSETGDEELLTVSHLTGVTPRSEKEVYMFEAETTQGYKICLKGDLVINTLWAWMGAMGVSPIKGIVSPAYNVYEPTAQLDSAYVDALVRLRVFAQEVTRYSKGVWSSRLRLYPEGFFETVLPVPPLNEQQEIASFLQTEGERMEALQTATVRTIALLKERRSSLIAAAVTGRVDVGGAA